MTTPFLASDALVRVARLRALIGVVTAALLALGPYDRFFVDLAPLLYSAREPVLPSLGAAFPVIRWLTVVLGLAVACGVRPAFTVPALALGFATVTGYVAVFVERSWSYNTHLLFVLLALSLAPTDRALSLVPDRRGGDRARDAELASFALWFSSLCIGLVYLQSGVAKGLGGGPAGSWTGPPPGRSPCSTAPPSAGGSAGGRRCSTCSTCSRARSSSRSCR